MAFVHTIDPNDPLDTDGSKFGAQEFRDLKAAVKERINSFFVDMDSDPWHVKTGAVFAGTATFNDVVAANAGLTATTVTATSNVIAGAASGIGWTGRTIMQSVSDGILTLTNNAGTDFTRLQLGGTSASFPALRRNGAGIDIVKADNSAYASMNVASLVAQIGNLQGVRVIGGTDVSGAVALGVFSDGNYSTTVDPAASLVSGLIVAKQSTSASGNNILMKTQYDQTVATTGAVYSIWATAQASHTSGTVNSLAGATIRASGTGNGGTSTTISALDVKAQVNAGHTVGTLNSIIIIGPTVNGTVTGNTVGLSIGNIGTGNTQFAIFTGSGLVQLGDQLICAASTTSRSSIRIPSGTAPTSPADGETWQDGTHAFMRIGGSNKQLDN